MGNISYLPEVGTKEYLELISAYQTAPVAKLKKWAKKYGYASYPNFCNSVFRRLGLSRKKPEDTVPDIAVITEVEHIPYPNFEIKPFKEPKSSRDEEDLGLVITDWHTAKVTESYNIDIQRARVSKLVDNLMTVINLHRPIRKVHIFALGDLAQGENPFQGSKIGETEMCAEEQIDDVAIPLLASLCTSLLQGVGEVDFYGVRGNHGKYAREVPDRTNWDIFIYKNLARALQNQPNINIYPPKWFYQLVNIRGFRFFTVHGDQVMATAGIPLFAMRRKMAEWYAYVGGFNYAYAGHFHTEAYDHVNSHADYTIAPPLVTGDSWALEKVGRASEPKQLCFGIHDKYGRTFKYDLHTDGAFLPKRFDEPEGIVAL